LIKPSEAINEIVNNFLRSNKIAWDYMQPLKMCTKDMYKKEISIFIRV